ncbi:hypothetical protein N5F13_25025 [Comamonas thiooxydans]|uniref:hypothetical protein n=1 Tax=Comamonas thiooxydans TaxID=363952 RepID=UPI0024477F8F|nr:hypothetical protein [Comamonas thiooxydans]MDH1477750.1 hypothetical protein [Comamonas thiooxydans]
MTDKNPLAHYSGVLSEAVQESAAANVPASGAAALSKYLETCEQHAIVPDVGGAFAFAFPAGFNLATSLATPDKRTDLVPGVMRCAKCEFQLVRQILAVNLGEVFAGDSKTEPCPNGCGPLWPVTWKQYAEQAMDAAETMADRAFAAEKEVKQLRGELVQHPDDVAVDALTVLMKAKLAKQRDKGYGGWDDTECSQQHLSNLLRGHVDKGDPVDVANFCAFLSARGEGIAPQAAPAAVAVPDAVRDAEKLLRAEAARLDRLYGMNKWYGFCAEKASRLEHLRVADALAATPVAAAPVVLPEPDFWVRPGATIHPDRGWQCWSNDGTATGAFHADTVRALLAGVSAPAAQAVEPTDAELIALNAGECYFGESPSKYPELGHGTQYHAGAPGVLGFARAALALRSDPAAYSQKFQQRVQPWMMTCFGPEISADRIERNHRFLEEALELVQSLGCTASEAHQLVDYVFGRPVGEPVQEAGGVMVTLAALCLASGLDMHACGETELARIWTKVEAIRAKQAAKPKHSPLPMHAPEAQADARDAESDYQRGYRHGYNRRDAEVQGALL